MKKILQLTTLGLCLIGQITAKTIFFPSGPQKFEVNLPFSVYTLPTTETKNRLPNQIIILGKEGSSIYVYEGNAQSEIKKLDATNYHALQGGFTALVYRDS